MFFKYVAILFLLSSLLNALNNKHFKLEKIADIPEASGICFNKHSNSLFVANDEGSVYEISTAGKILRKKRLGDYDLEGVACKKNVLYFAVEGRDSVLIVNQADFSIKEEIKIKSKYRGTTIIVRDKKHGLEGITIKNGMIYLSNQSYNRYPKKDPSVVFTIKDKTGNKKSKIKKIYDHGYDDIAGLTIYKNQLYMVSDKKNLLINLDRKKEYKIPKFAQEGVCFDNKGYIYFADDEGFVMKGIFDADN